MAKWECRFNNGPTMGFLNAAQIVSLAAKEKLASDTQVRASPLDSWDLLRDALPRLKDDAAVEAAQAGRQGDANGDANGDQKAPAALVRKPFELIEPRETPETAIRAPLVTAASISLMYGLFSSITMVFTLVNAHGGASGLHSTFVMLSLPGVAWGAIALIVARSRGNVIAAVIGFLLSVATLVMGVI